MVREWAEHCESLIYILVLPNELAYFQLITVLFYGSSPTNSHEQGYLNFSKNLEKYVWSNSFLVPATLLKINFFLDIFQGFCLKVSEDFYWAPLCIFVHGLFMIIQNYVNNKINNSII